MANAWIVKPLPMIGAFASSTAIGEPAFVGNDYAGVIWRSAPATGGAGHAIALDMGADVTADTIMLFGAAGATSAWTLTIDVATQAQGTAFTAGSYTAGVVQPFLAGSVMPASGNGVAVWQAPGAPITGRYWRIVVGLPSGALTIARAVVGKRIQLDRNFGYGASFGVRDLGSLDFSARGVMLRRRARTLRTVGLTFSNIRRAEVEATTQPLLEQIGNTEMIALLTDPAADAQRQNRAYYGALVGDLGQVWRNAAAFETKINLVSIF